MTRKNGLRGLNMVLRNLAAKFTLKLLVIGLMMAFASACSKDDVDREEPALIIGKWTPTKFVYKELVGGAWEETTDDEDDLDFIEFYKEGKGKIVGSNFSGTETLDLTYTANSVTYGETDIIGPPGGVYSIKSLTATQLVLYQAGTELTVEITLKK